MMSANLHTLVEYLQACEVLTKYRTLHAIKIEVNLFIPIISIAELLLTDCRVTITRKAANRVYFFSANCARCVNS